MVTPPSALADADLSALADLERRVVAADGGRLKLEWPVLRAGGVQAVLERDADRLRGFVGLYRFGRDVELVGAVDPDARRRGLGGALLDAALAACPGDDVLLVVPGASVGGRALALSRGGVLDHSEHALVLDGPPAAGEDDPRTALRPARPADAALVRALASEAFGVELAPGDGTLVVERDGVAVGSLRLTRDGETASVHGFVVAPERRGEGIGRDVLRRACRSALQEGAVRVALEVAVDNPGALGLYTSTGFVPVTTEDYYRLS